MKGTAAKIPFLINFLVDSILHWTSTLEIHFSIINYQHYCKWPLFLPFYFMCSCGHCYKMFIVPRSSAATWLVHAVGTISRVNWIIVIFSLFAFFPTWPQVQDHLQKQLRLKWDQITKISNCWVKGLMALYGKFLFFLYNWSLVPRSTFALERRWP